jgi:hypothetical protein
MWVKAVNPENRVIDTIADAIGAVVHGKLHDPAEAERAQSRIVKGGGTGDVRDTDPCMVDHCGVLSCQRVAECYPCKLFRKILINQPFRPEHRPGEARGSYVCMGPRARIQQGTKRLI